MGKEQLNEYINSLSEISDAFLYYQLTISITTSIAYVIIFYFLHKQNKS